MTSHIPALMLREWMQHKRGWLLTLALPPALVLALLPFGEAHGLPEDQPLAACATAVKPHHLGVGGSLVDEHQPGRIKQTLFAYPASACLRYVRALLLRRAQAFF